MPVLQLVWRAVPIAAAAVLVLLYGHILRPIWYDEFVYYVLGSYSDLGAIWAVFRETAGGENQGQTGVFQVALGVILGTFGGSLVSLRILSVAATVVFLASALLFLRMKGLRTFGLVAFLALVAGSPQFMYYSVEARVYLPLAAACSLVLSMYSLPAEQKRQPWARVITWVAVLALAVIHPYAAIYLPLIVTFTYVDDSLEQRHSLSVKAWLTWAGWQRMTGAAVVYVVLASQTWLRGQAGFSADPWEFLDRPLWLELLHEHLVPVFTTWTALTQWGLLLALAVIGAVVMNGPRSLWVELRMPLLLMGMALGASILLVALSFTQGFWIISRQWIASIGLVLIAFSWLLWKLWLTLSRIRRSFGLTFAVVATAIIILNVAPIAVWQLSNLKGSIADFPVQVEGNYSQAALKSRIEAGDEISTRDWVRFAHQNTVIGGRVWDEFQNYYGRAEATSYNVIVDPDQLTIQ